MEFLSDKAYRPHLPFPVSYHLLMVGKVDSVTEPTNPDGDEQITEIGSFPIEQACQHLKTRKGDGHFIAEMYRYAADFLAAKQTNEG